MNLPLWIALGWSNWTTTGVKRTANSERDAHGGALTSGTEGVTCRLCSYRAAIDYSDRIRTRRASFAYADAGAADQAAAACAILAARAGSRGPTCFCTILQQLRSANGPTRWRGITEGRIIRRPKLTA